MQIKVPDPDSRTSASAESADNHLLGRDAAQAEADRIASWTKPNFTPGRHQAQLDPSYRKTGKG
jgi:hypothetical protein